MLKIEDTALIVIDVQGKLAKIMHQSSEILRSIENLIKGAQLLNIPILWLEQYPKGLGATSDQLKQHLTESSPIEKMVFSACKNEEFQKELEKLNRNSMLVCGIETHICVYQTVQELLHLGKNVEVVVDGVSSRSLANKQIGLEKMTSLGAKVTSVEMALFELIQTAEHPKFKEISKIIK